MRSALLLPESPSLQSLRIAAGLLGVALTLGRCGANPERKGKDVLRPHQFRNGLG